MGNSSVFLKGLILKSELCEEVRISLQVNHAGTFTGRVQENKAGDEISYINLVYGRFLDVPPSWMILYGSNHEGPAEMKTI